MTAHPDLPASHRRGAEVSVAGVAKTFPGGTRALQPTDLNIASGETLVLLGPSGCGKTTLLRLIAGLEEADPGGTISFDGEDVTPWPIERRGVGMVFQSYALFPNMDVLDNVAYGLRVRGVRRSERHKAAHDVLAMCRIEELAARRIDELSGGQRQRVALARALVVRPRILLLDEPLTALDANLREALRGEIDALLRSLSITTVYVTHDQSEALMLADRIAVMDKGTIAQIGSPREIYNAPATPYVAAFVGVSNQIGGHVEAGVFRCAHGEHPVALGDGPATIHFRPEDVEIAPAGDAGLLFEVRTVTYLGTTQLLTLRDAERTVRVVAPAAKKVAEGERIRLRLPPTAIKTFAP